MRLFDSSFSCYLRTCRIYPRLGKSWWRMQPQIGVFYNFPLSSFLSPSVRRNGKLQSLVITIPSRSLLPTLFLSPPLSRLPRPRRAGLNADGAECRAHLRRKAEQWRLPHRHVLREAGMDGWIMPPPRQCHCLAAVT